MKKYALVNKTNNIIEQIVEASIQPSYSSYHVKDLTNKESFNKIGELYSDEPIDYGPKVVEVVVADASPPAMIKIIKLTPTEFKMQFTPEERLAIREFRTQTTNENSTIAYYAKLIDDSMDLLDKSQFVYLDNPQVQALVYSLVDMGLLASTARADKILEGF